MDIGHTSTKLKKEEQVSQLVLSNSKIKIHMHTELKPQKEIKTHAILDIRNDIFTCSYSLIKIVSIPNNRFKTGCNSY